MNYQYKGESQASQALEAHTHAKFEYFRKAETAINAGPARVEYHPAPFRPRGERAACGTHSGYKTHINNRTAPCQPCREARAIYQREYRRRQKNQEIAA
jgi:hypothetical protein